MFSGTNAAVVVTFNRKQLLLECIEALLRQTQSLNAIFVVDNASSDGTGEFLREHGVLTNPVVHYQRLPENLGGAGGFHAGMLAAYEAGFDWIWVMDDDTEPRLDSLERMQALKAYPGVAAIANRKLDARGADTSDGLRFMGEPETQGREYRRVRFSSFVGLLIRSSVIARVGLPRPEFFIHNDDTEYCIRIRAVGDIAFAAESVVVHKEMARRERGRKIFSHVFYQKDVEAFCFDYYGQRNYAWILQRHCKNPLIRYATLAGRFACFAAAVAAFDRDFRWQRLKILAKANLDGIRGKFDNSFPQRMRENIRMRRSQSG